MKKDLQQKIKIIGVPKEYLLRHGELTPAMPLWETRRDNAFYFARDVMAGKINYYEGTFVAYRRGALVGQSKNKRALYHKAREYYGTLNLTVFPVPTQKTDKSIEDAVKNAIENTS